MSTLMRVRQTCSQWNRLVLGDCRMPPTQDRLATLTVVLDRKIVQDGKKTLVAAAYNPIHGAWFRQLLPWHRRPAVPGFSSSFVEAVSSLLLYFLTPTTVARRSRFLVFNPVTGSFRLLPELAVPKHSSGSGVKLVPMVGAGAARRGNGGLYRVVLVTFVVHGRDRRSITHVYRSDIDCWRSSKSFKLNDKEEWPGTGEWGPKGACSSGRLAYFTFKTEERPWTRKLMAFDVVEEKWSKVTVPAFSSDNKFVGSHPALASLWMDTDAGILGKIVSYDLLYKSWEWLQSHHMNSGSVSVAFEELDSEDDDLSYPEEYGRPLCFSPCSHVVP